MAGLVPRLSGWSASLSQPSWPGLSRPSTSGRAAVHHHLSAVTGRLFSRGGLLGSPRRGWPGQAHGCPVQVSEPRSLNRHGRAKSRPSTSGRATIHHHLSAIAGSVPSRGRILGSPRRGWPGQAHGCPVEVSEPRSLNRHGRAKSRPSTSGRAIIHHHLSAIAGSVPSRGCILGSPRRGWPVLRPAMTLGRTRLADQPDGRVSGPHIPDGAGVAGQLDPS